jgi:hypothetical protein
MTIKQNGGVFGRNPTFNDVTIEGDLIINGEVFTGLDFQGSWNASTNSPTLASSVGTNGEFYIVSVAGGTNLNGITNWGIGDWAIFNGTAWQRVEGGADGNFNALTANSLIVSGIAKVSSADQATARVTIDNLNGQAWDLIAGTAGASNSGFGIYDGDAGVTRIQIDSSGNVAPGTDNTQDLGSASKRWAEIYAGNATINTSDRNEKQDIKKISDAEQSVAVACKGLLRKFRWKSAVAEKGDTARTHFGIIAQDLQAAFEAEGLDAGDYGMFISTTWWEFKVAVDAVEAVDEVTDEEGNVTTKAVEAKDAYTRIDTVCTLEEAPVDATERTRLGVRYSELLAFIIAAL